MLFLLAHISSFQIFDRDTVINKSSFILCMNWLRKNKAAWCCGERDQANQEAEGRVGLPTNLIGSYWAHSIHWVFLQIHFIRSFLSSLAGSNVVVF